MNRNIIEFYENVIVVYKMGTILIDEFYKRFKELYNKESNKILIHCIVDLMNVLDDYFTGLESYEFYTTLEDINTECDLTLRLMKDEKKMRFHSWLSSKTCHFIEKLLYSDVEELFNQVPTDYEIRILKIALNELKYGYSGRDLECIGLCKNDIQMLLDKYES